MVLSWGRPDLLGPQAVVVDTQDGSTAPVISIKIVLKINYGGVYDVCSELVCMAVGRLGFF